MVRVIAVDPGDVRIGLAISDPTGTIARPLKVFRHRSRKEDVERILLEVEIHSVETILVGVAYDMDGMEGPQARKALRLVRMLRENTSKVVETWDESGSSHRALQLGKKDDLIDARAATVILQEYLDGT